MKKISSIFCLLGFCCLSVSATEWYVIGKTGDDANSGLSPKEAFRTLQKAADIVEPGDIVYIGDGTYSPADPHDDAVLEISRSGREDAWIVWKAMKGQEPMLRPTGWNGILVYGSYHVIDGLTVIGPNDSIALKNAIADAAKKTPDMYFNTNGIYFNGRMRSPEEKPHHLVVRNCTVCKCGGGGIIGIEIDYMTVENCDVFDNAWYARYACSGISMLNNWAYDDAPGYHIVIRNNVVWNNRGLVPWQATGKLSDGNGIILDVTDPDTPAMSNPDGDAFVSGQQETKKTVRPLWNNRSLIENNLSAFNGGSGIHCFRTSNVDIVNNITYWNGSVVDYQELFPNVSRNIVIKNNIIVPRPGGKVTSDNKNTDITWDGNVYPSEQNVFRGANDMIAMPEFVRPNRELDPRGFRIRNAGMFKGKGADMKEILKNR